MSMDIAKARGRFARSLLGTWRSNLGGGHGMLLGMSLAFCDDGTGTMVEWGFDHQHVNPEYVSDPAFGWRSVADQTIEFTYRHKARVVKYDFTSRQNEYGILELRVFEVGRTPDEHGEIGFWISPFSLVYQDPGPEAPRFMKRLWEKLIS